MRGPAPLVRVLRSGVIESVHLGSVAVSNAAGDLVAATGDPDRLTFARSAMKPLQAAVSLSLVADELDDAEVAVMCGSHGGEPVHVDTVERLLGRAGLGFDALRCPPALPLDPEAAAAAAAKARQLHNCSGKHAGMLLACAGQGWDPATYLEARHPLQERILDAVRRASAADPALGIDGCGLPVQALPLRSLARLWASLATPGDERDTLPNGRALAAMRAEPYLVAGRDRADTDILTSCEGVVVKTGAEGVICGVVADRGWGVAVKIEDGASRAAPPALLHALRLLGALPEQVPDPVERWLRPPVLGGGAPVGRLEPEFELAG